MNMEKSIIEQFAEYIVKNRGLSEKTASEYRKDLREIQWWMRENEDVVRWSQIDKTMIDNMVAYWYENNLKPATISRRIACLRSFYQYAWVRGLQKENPAKYVSTPKVAFTLPKTLSHEEIGTTIVDGSIDLTTRKMIAVLAETGLRISELLSIRMNDIDKVNNRILVHGKGNKERSVFYGEMTKAVIENTRAISNGKLFQLSDRNARWRIHNALRQHTNKQKCSSHIIRHSYATEMLNAGAQITTIQNLLGHKSVTTTERYAQVAGQKVATEYKQYRPNYYGRQNQKEIQVG